MNHYYAKKETYNAYEYLINMFRKNGMVLEYSSATVSENENCIANEIYSHFGTHYFKCINSLKAMSVLEDYKNIVDNIKEINILDIGCNIGTATYAYIDNYLETKDENYIGNINIIFIEMSPIRVRWLREMFDVYVNDICRKYHNINITYTIINEAFPVELNSIRSRLIKAPIIILISNFTNWNNEEELARDINDLFNIDGEKYLLNIETNSQLKNITNIINYMKKYKIYSIMGPIMKSNFEYDNFKCSVWKGNTYQYTKNRYYQTTIREQDMYEYISNKNRMSDIVNKTINTLNSLIITDEIEVNYLIKNKINIIDISKEILKEHSDRIYSSNFMTYDLPKKDGTTRPLIVEDSIAELISTSIITSIGLCIDNIQNEDISFGNRLEEKDEVPYITKNFMEQYFNKFILNQKKIKEDKNYLYYVKLDLKEYYKNIGHTKLLDLLEEYLNNNTWFKEKEWFLDIIRKYINRDGISDKCYNKGISQGLPLSGVLSNIYLNSYDNWFENNFNEDQIFRYVDDMIIFTDKNVMSNTGIINNYTDFIENELYLELNKAKTEKGEVGNLEFYDLNSNYREISELSKEIYIAIYNVPSSIYNLYIKDNEKIINLLFESLKSIGIYISKSWLSKKIRKRKSYYSGIKINYGKMYGKGNVDFDKWKREFKFKNATFINKLEKLNDKLREEFKNINDEIKNGNKETLTMRKFKFIYNKLGTFINKNIVNEEFFEYIYTNPWLVDLKKLRGYSNLTCKVYDKIDKKNTNYCNLILVWLIGEYEANQYMDFIWEIYIDTLKIYTPNFRLLNTKACETILKLLRSKEVDIEKIEHLKNLYISKLNTSCDYIYLRNIIMLLNVLDHDWIMKNMKEDQLSLELQGVLSYVKNKPGENIIEVLEPMYKNYGEFLPNEEPMGNLNSIY